MGRPCGMISIVGAFEVSPPEFYFTTVFLRTQTDRSTAVLCSMSTHHDTIQNCLKSVIFIAEREST